MSAARFLVSMMQTVSVNNPWLLMFFCVSIDFLVIVWPIFPFSSYSGFARNQYQLISHSWWQTCHLDHHSHLLSNSTIDHAIVANCWFDPVFYLFKFCPNPVDPGRCYFGTVGPITLCFLLGEILSLVETSSSVVFVGQKTRWVVEMCLSLRVKSVKSIWDHYWGPNFDPIHHLKWACPPNHPNLDHVDPFWYWNLWFWRSLILRHLHWYCGWSPFLITQGNDSNIYESVLLFLRSAGAAMGLEGAHLVPGTIWTTWGCVKTLWFWAIPARGHVDFPFGMDSTTNWHHFLVCAPEVL